MIWGALGSQGLQSNAPVNTVWRSQFQNSLDWVLAFLSGQRGSLVRSYSFSTYARLGLKVEMVLDASPWGIGGYLREDNVLKSYFWEKISEEEAAILRCTLGTSEAQQAFESFAALAALRLWSKRWPKERTVLCVKSDSLATLLLSLNLKSRGFGCNLVAREMALDIAEMSYKPDVAQHVRGIANIGADTLSRMAAPGSDKDIPEYFADVQRDRLLPRGKDLFRSLL